MPLGILLALVVLAGSDGYDHNAFVGTWLDVYNGELQVYEHEVSVAEYNFLTNITKETKKEAVEAEKIKAMWESEMMEKAREFELERVDADSRRQLSIILTDAKPKEPEIVELMDSIQRDMQGIHGRAKVCSKNQCLGEGELKRLMAESRDYDKLLEAWVGFRNATGPPMKEKYGNFVNLLNIGATENGYPDMGYFWRVREMDDGHFDEAAMHLYEQLKPMYVRLHGYVRHKLMKLYPGKMKKDGPIPAHLLGNMWAQNWNNLIDVLAPYPDAAIPDITRNLREKNMTALDIFKVAEKFYLSIGLLPMTKKFWQKSLIEKPKDGRHVACHGTAFDFFLQDDFRIKKCTQLTTDDFVSVHHEMGHVEYFMHYRHLPSIYRSSPNTGFHEGVADVSSLSVLTPSYLSSLGLTGAHTDHESYMNFLMEMALRKIAFLPFGLLIDLYRWQVFNGTITQRNYNHGWWRMRIDLQGVLPPVDRSVDDFDPGSKAHIPHNVPYIRYFVSFISQFQLHESLCKAAGHRGPLYLCNIAGSRRAGALLRRFMRLGRSKPWPEALATLTGYHRLDARPIINYFQPLVQWMDKYIDDNDVTTGWRTDNLGVHY